MTTIKKYQTIAIKNTLIVLLLISNNACKKNLLDPVSVTNISDGSAFDNPSRITAQVNGLYTSLKSIFFYGGSLIIYSELRGDEFILNKPNITTGQLTWSQAVTPNAAEVMNIWSGGYATINSVNTFLAGLESNRRKVNEEQYSNFVAEAKFIRALCYYALVQTYAQPFSKDNGASLGVPLRLRAEKSNENNQLARSTVAEIYAQILADLDAAELGLPSKYATTVLNTTRPTKNTAIAFKTRVNLAKGDYRSLIAEAEKIVSDTAPFQAPATGVNHKLEANISTVFAGSYAGSESVFSLPFTATEPGQLANFFTNSPGNGTYFLNPVGTIADPVYSSATSADARKELVSISAGEKWLNKFKVPNTFSDWVPVIRYSEVLLNYAEALARLEYADSRSRATALVAAVRNRSDAAYVFPASSISTQDALLNTILRERSIELLGEGFRLSDLQRRGLALPAKSGAQGNSPSIPPTDKRYIWPISSAETTINLLIVQNPQ